jgi:hypothetical protein
MNKLFFIIIILLTSCNTSIFKKAEETVVREIKFGYVELEIDSKEELKSSPTGYRTTTKSKFVIVKDTDTVKAENGVQFGVEYFIKHKSNKSIPLVLVWKYPSGMKGADGKPLDRTKYRIKKETNCKQSSYYSLEDGFYIRGTWTFQIFYKRKLLYEKDFHLI